MEARVEDSDSFQRAFGEALIAAGKLDKSGLERALRLVNGRDERLANVLAKLGLVNERDLAAALAAQLNAPLVEPVHIPDAPLEIAQLSAKFLKQRRILPLAETEDGYVLAMADPLDEYADKPTVSVVQYRSGIHTDAMNVRVGSCADLRDASAPRLECVDDPTFTPERRQCGGYRTYPACTLNFGFVPRPDIPSF